MNMFATTEPRKEKGKAKHIDYETIESAQMGRLVNTNM